jgi:DHA1 family bicyclomycin/chloramphenicol resistance-like MFS transporter
MAPTGTLSAEPAAALGAAAHGREFVALVASCMGMAAMSIDVVLPAFAGMREDFGLPADSTRVSWVITAFFLGLAAGQLVYGPLSDRFGRKPLLYAGLVLYIVGAAAAAVAPSLATVIACRVVWGLGAAGPRSLALAMVRDTFEGDRMARTMSHAMAIFVLVPVFAPGLGAALLVVAPWQAVFWLPVVAAVALLVWVTTRLPETLPPERRRAVTPAALGRAFMVVVRTRRTLAFGLAVTCLFGIMSSYIASSEIIIDEVFGQKDLFPLIFGALACMLGVGSLLNARLVTTVGLDRIVRVGAGYLFGVALVGAVVALATDGRPPLWAFCVLMGLLLPGVAVLLPNSNTAAMAPVPHVAGMAAAVLGTLSTAGGALLGSRVDTAFDGSVRPFAVGALLLASVIAASILLLAGRAPARPAPPGYSSSPAAARSAMRSSS